VVGTVIVGNTVPPMTYTQTRTLKNYIN